MSDYLFEYLDNDELDEEIIRAVEELEELKMDISELKKYLAELKKAKKLRH